MPGHTGSSKWKIMDLLTVAFCMVAMAGAALPAIKALEKREKDWVKTALGQDLRPCYPNIAHVRLGHSILKAQDQATEEEVEAWIDAGRVIPAGSHHAGLVIPEHCFAVQSGLGGLTITFWQRPILEDGGFDMSIPYWTPSPEDRAA